MKIDGSIMIPVNCILEQNLPTTIVGNQWYISVKNANDTVGKLWVPNSNGIPVCLGDTPITDSKLASLENQINVLSSLQNGFKFYYEFTQIDSSFSNTTDIASICSKMSAKSIAMLDVGNNTSIYPSNYGFMIIHKLSSSRCELEFSSHETNIFAKGTWHMNASFSGWKVLATTDQLSALETRITDLENALGGIS
ncbi:MAG: hypothetical protein ACI3T9_02390 [Romboutsia timonensis]